MIKKRSWYDGWFYAMFIDRQKSRFRKKIVKSIPGGQKVLDVGCGTGGLCLDIAEEAKYVLGIDISGLQINVANQRKNRISIQNLEFKQADARDLKGVVETNYDFATIILIIHEVSPTERSSILSEVKKYTNKVVILDYADKIPISLWGIGTYLIEFFAGYTHFSNFRDYLKNGGIIPLLEEAGYKFEISRVDRSGIFRFVVVTS